MSWCLENGEVLHVEYPNTFEIPDEWMRKSLQPGMFAKLIFVSEDGGGERMWVNVTKVLADGYVGTLTNHPCCTEGVKHGDLIPFKKEHVIDVHVID